MRRWIFQGLAVLGVVGGLVGGLIWLGQQARKDLAEHERFQVQFSAVECPAPPGLSRLEFLEEVRYLGGFPERLPRLEDGLAERLSLGFARHPWVARVTGVNLALADRIQVQLDFRMPVLAVAHGTGLRAVDASGVLLPKSAPTEGLPVFSGQARPPLGPAGSSWGDPAVEAAAKVAAK